MRKLLFRSCEAADGRKFAFLTDQPEVEECFDNGYMVAYKNRDDSKNVQLLAQWKKAFTVSSEEFTLLPENDEIPEEVTTAFNNMVTGLLKGIDVFFCDYNLGIEGDLPMCNEIMELHKSTDFVLFSCADIVGDDPSVQPYMVSYAAPRYQEGKQLAKQHRIYCKTDHFAFGESINAIVTLRDKNNLSGGHIRKDLDPYIAEEIVSDDVAHQAISRFVEMVKRLNGDVKALAAPM